MSWITFIWTLTAGICLTLGAVQFLVWTRRRDEPANLVFSITAAAVIENTRFAHSPRRRVQTRKWTAPRVRQMPAVIDQMKVIQLIG